MGAWSKPLSRANASASAVACGSSSAHSWSRIRASSLTVRPVREPSALHERALLRRDRVFELTREIAHVGASLEQGGPFLLGLVEMVEHGRWFLQPKLMQRRKHPDDAIAKPLAFPSWETPSSPWSTGSMAGCSAGGVGVG